MTDLEAIVIAKEVFAKMRTADLVAIVHLNTSANVDKLREIIADEIEDRAFAAGDKPVTSLNY